MSPSSTKQSAEQIALWAQEYETKSARDLLTLAFNQFHDIAISFSGAEDVVLIDLATKINPNVRVFTLDTGRLHPETYEYLEQVKNHYDIKLEVTIPDATALSNLVSQKGLFSFYKEGHQECCGIRKVAPLKNKLSTLSAWITGQRKDQSPGTRTAIPLVQVDPSFSTAERSLIKFNPIASWSSERVWSYIRENNVPYNKLHEKGFVSIGCQPCTRAILPNQH